MFPHTKPSIILILSLLSVVFTNCDPHKEIVFKDKIVEKEVLKNVFKDKIVEKEVLKNILVLGSKYPDKPKIIALARSLKDANNLLVEIKDLAFDFEGKRYNFKQFVTETGPDKFIADSLFKLIEKDSKNWKTTVTFKDDSRQIFYSIGDSLHHDGLKINPYGNNPLAANLYVDMPIKGVFSVEVKGKGGNGVTIKKMFGRVMNGDTLPILGLYPNYHNIVEIGFYNEDKKLRFKRELVVETEDVDPFQKRSVIIEKNVLSNEYNGLYISPNYQIGWDVQGQIRWVFFRQFTV